MCQKLWKVQTAGPKRNKNFPPDNQSLVRDTQIDAECQSTSVDCVMMEDMKKYCRNIQGGLTRTSKSKLCFTGWLVIIQSERMRFQAE